MFRSLLILLVGLFFAGCHARPVEEAPLAPSSQPEPPFEIRIVQEFNDGHDLSVVADVVPRVAWANGPVVVRLAVLSAGDLQSTKVVSLANDPTTSAALMQKETVQVRLQAPVGTGSDYQLELLWGDEAQQYAAEAVAERQRTEGPPDNKASVQLRGVTVVRAGRSCGGPGCGVSFTLSGELFNSGNSNLSEITLGVSFQPRGAGRLDLGSNLPENEDQVEVSGLQLAPGAARPFEFEVAPPPFEKYASSFEPVLRVVDAK